MSWAQIQEPAPTSFAKTDLEFSNFKAETSKCLRLKYKSHLMSQKQNVQNPFLWSQNKMAQKTI